MSAAILQFCKKHPAWPAVQKILQHLEASGHQAVLAGGCVRDACLKLTPKDLDVATAATPQQVMALFSKTIPVGLAFGVVRVIQDGHSIEVATFRKDGEYVDGRHPQRIEFADLEADASRRDFTVNAMFYSLSRRELFDPTGGVKDLRERVLRTVGDPFQRFKEDHLRLIRAIRLAARLDLSINDKTWRALTELAPLIKAVARERVIDELRKLCLADRAWIGWAQLLSSGLLAALVPELKISYSCLLPFSGEGQSPLWVFLGWFAFASGATAPQLKKWLVDLKASRDEMQKAEAVRGGLALMLTARRGTKLKLIAHNEGPWLVNLWPTAQRLRGQLDLQEITDVVTLYKKMMDDRGYLPQPLLDGNDIIAWGRAKPQEFRAILDQMYAQQLEENINDKAKMIFLLNEIGSKK